MNSPKISVIIPVYNAESTLRRCVDSILAQTFTDFECLLINDVAAGYTDCVIWDSDNVAKEVKKQLTVPMEMTGKQIIQFGINHQSVFIKTELLRVHPYDENLKFVSDYKLFIQVLVIEGSSYDNSSVKL